MSIRTIFNYHRVSKTLLTLATFAMLLVPFGALVVPNPKPVEAACAPVPPIFVPNPIAVTVQTFGANDLAAQGAEMSNFFLECVLNPMAIFIAKTIIKQITLSIVNWINSGFQGNPGFIQNPGQFFTKIGDRVAGRMIEQVAPFLCKPFKLDLSLMLAFSFGLTKIEDDVGCTLTDVENNTSEFADDINRQVDVAGGKNWNEFFRVSQNPNNNPDGALLKARSKIGAGIISEQDNLNLLGGWGNGFLGLQECPGDKKTALGIDKKQGTNEVGNFVTRPRDNNVYDSNNQPVYGVHPDQKGCMIKTPGVLVQDQLSSVIGSDLRGLEVAQSLDAIFGALLGQLLKTALGPGGLTEASDPSTSSVTGNNAFLDVGGEQFDIGLPNPPITGSCVPSTSATAIGEQMVWSMYANQLSGNNLQYIWGGSELATTSPQATPSISMIYKETGVKTMTVIVKRPVQRVNGKTISSDEQPFECIPTLRVDATTPTDAVKPVIPADKPQAAGDLVCRAFNQTQNVSVPINDTTVTYTVTDAGEKNTVRYAYRLESTAGNYRSQAPGILHATTTPENDRQIDVTYFDPAGIKSVKVTAYKKSGQQWETDCPLVRIDGFSCKPSKTKATTGDLVFWTVEPPAGAVDNPRTYTWRGEGITQTGNNQSANSTSRTATAYTTKGQKSLEVDVTETNTHKKSLTDWTTKTWTFACESVTIE